MSSYKKRSSLFHRVIFLSLSIAIGFCIFRFLEVYFLNIKKQSAAERGIQWVLRQKDTIPPKDALWYLKDLYQVTWDKKFSQQIAQGILEKEKEIPKDSTSVESIDVKSNTPWFSVVFALLQKQCFKENIFSERAYIRKIVSENWEEIFPKDTYLAGKIVKTYFLLELGAVDDIRYSDVISEIKSHTPPREHGVDLAYVYALTHIVITKSDYFAAYLDPKDHRTEIGLLQRAVKDLVRTKETDGSISDVSSEVLFSLKLLKQRPNNDMEALYQKIISLQRADGSWIGNDPDSTFHHTVMAVLALLDYPQDLPQAKIYCPFGIKP